MDKLKNNQIKYLDEYKEFVKQFEMVGSNVLYLSKDGYLENIQTGYSSIEKEEFTKDTSIYRIASISPFIIEIGQYYDI